LKEFTARRLIAQVEIERREWLLKILRDFRLSHKHKSTYQVWQEGFHPQALYSDETISQKLEYLQNNPVRAGFVAAPEHWRYSSAHEWCDGAIPVMRCDDWRQMRREERNRVSGEKAVPKQSFGTRDEKRTALLRAVRPRFLAVSETSRVFDSRLFPQSLHLRSAPRRFPDNTTQARP